MKKLNLIIVLAAGLLIFSCKKDKITQSPQSTHLNDVNNNLNYASRGLSPCVGTTGISANAGVLEFSTKNHFNDVVRDIQFRHDSLCNSDSLDFFKVSRCFESNFNYTSLRSIIYDSHIAALNHDTYDIANDLDGKYMPHVGIRTVCNNKGEVKIEGELHVFTSYGDVFIVHDGSTNFTNAIISQNFNALRNVSRYKMDGSEYYYDNNGAEVLRNGKKDCKTWNHLNNKYYNSGRRMIRLRNWTLNLPTLNTSGSETWAYRKVGSTWVLAWVNGLNVTFGGSIHNTNCDWMVNMSGSNSGNNVHHRRTSNDIWTSNGFAMNVARRVNNGTFGGNAWHSNQSGTLNITVH